MIIIPADGGVPAITPESRAIDSGREMTEILDQELVARVQGGDKRAFDLLVRRYQGKVVGLVSRYIRDPVEAEDVVQEAFIKAYRSLGRFRGESAFYTWLYRIAVNTAKNHIVASARRPPAQDLDAEVAENSSAGERLREISTPEGAAMTRQIGEVIQSTLGSMPDELREALVLREFEGLSYEEIAEVMECPVGTVRSRIFRAREAIDQAIGDLLP